MTKNLILLGRNDALSKTLLRRFEKASYACHHLGKDAETYRVSPDLETSFKTIKPDTLVVYPPYQGRGTFLDSTAAEWEEAIGQNIEATTLLLQMALSMFTASGAGGRIIVLSHVSAIAPLRGLSLMGTTLSALNALVKMLALELAPHGVTVNSIAVGPQAAGVSLSKDAAHRLEHDTPLSGNLFEDAADLCLFLSSGAAQRVTGQVLRADGGFLLTRGQGVSPFAL